MRHLPEFLTPEYPSTYTLEITSACNHKCIGCGNVFPHNSIYMAAQKWIHILDLLRPHIHSVRVTGGECTLHPEFSQIIQAVDQLDIEFVVFTNGNWKKPERIIELLAGCKNLKGLLISLQGYDTDSSKAFVTANSFESVTRNIQKSVADGISVSTNTVLSKLNFWQIDKIVKLGLSLGVSSVAFSRYYGIPRTDLELSPKELYLTILHIASLHKRDQRIVFNNCVPYCFIKETSLPMKGCTSGFTHCTLDPAGNVRPCTHSPIILGNILEESISTIWQSDTLRKWRAIVPHACSRCSAFSLCRGGCRATAYQQGLTKDPLIRKPIKGSCDVLVQNIELYRYLRPRPEFKLVRRKSGIYIKNKNQRLSISEQALPILDLLDGIRTLDDVESSFGQLGIDFVGTLYLSGMVQLE